MDASSLRRQLNNLDASRSSLHSSFRFWEWAVVIGVALEFVVLAVEYWDEWQAFIRATIRLPEKPKTWLFVTGFIGVAMVAGGIARELHVDSLIEGVETQTKAANEQLFGIVSQEAETATSLSSAAKSDAKAAHEEADAVKESAIVLRAQLADEKQKLNSVEEKRAALEKSLVNLAACNAPRVLTTWWFQTGTIKNPIRESSIDSLRSFAGEDVVIEIEPNDAEVRRAAWELFNTLRAAQWNPMEPVTREGIKDGVAIAPFVADDNDRVQIGAGWHAADAADTLIDFLHSYFWDAKTDWLVDNDGGLIRGPKVVPLGGLRVRIGLYPAKPFIAPPGAKDAAVLSEQIMSQWAQRRKRDEEEDDKRFAERLRSAPADQVEAMKAARAKGRERMEKAERGANSPCQPMSTIFPTR